MKKINYLLLVLVPGIIGTLAFLLPREILLTHRILIVLIIISTYLLIIYTWDAIKIKKISQEKDELLNKVSTLEEILNKHEVFLNKRELFIKHDLKNMNKAANTYKGYIYEAYRGNRYTMLRDEVHHFVNSMDDIINKEMRDFDEQLFDIQSNKNNR